MELIISSINMRLHFGDQGWSPRKLFYNREGIIYGRFTEGSSHGRQKTPNPMFSSRTWVKSKEKSEIPFISLSLWKTCHAWERFRKDPTTEAETGCLEGLSINRNRMNKLLPLQAWLCSAALHVRPAGFHLKRPPRRRRLEWMSVTMPTCSKRFLNSIPGSDSVSAPDSS